MKKTLAILLSCFLLLSLFACGEKGGTADTPTDPASSPAESSSPTSQTQPSDTSDPADPSGSPDVPATSTGEIGRYDPNRDYFNRDPYKVIYISYAVSSFGELLNMNFEGWASVLNIDYSWMQTNNVDDFYTALEVCANEGYDAYILDGDATLGDKTKEITAELGITNWLGATSALRDENGVMMWPAVTMDSYKAGQDQISWAWENYSSFYDGDADPASIGVVSVDYSVIPNLHLVADGVKGWLSDNAVADGFNMDNYLVADAAGRDFTAETAYDLVSTLISSNSNISHWIITTCMEPFGVGASRACEELDKIGKAIVISQDGTTLFAQWDTGYEGCWVAALTSPLQFFTEPIMCGLLAMIEGETTPEDIWPDHKAPGEDYANRIVLSTMVTKENYKQFHADLAERAPY